MSNSKMSICVGTQKYTKEQYIEYSECETNIVMDYYNPQNINYQKTNYIDSITNPIIVWEYSHLGLYEIKDVNGIIIKNHYKKF